MAPMAAGNLVAVAMSAAVLLLLAAAAAANQEGEALTAFRKGLRDPNGALASWDPNLVNPCTWGRLTCDDDNRVTGIISLDLYNNIEGSIPPEFGNLENLISLDLYNNNISGPIPPSLGKLKSLGYMRMDHNRLTGQIPNELVGLSNLMVLNLSNNDLCGTIPTSGPFERFLPSSFANNPRLRVPQMGLHDGDDG
uniref:Leucine-rich repeat-containing N-terminal plant-type domain-containing protein n=2 Tax=Oryza brachyantha TaxID=4533 RepID=J3M8E2_ORYBR